jgi:hypothetical protein
MTNTSTLFLLFALLVGCSGKDVYVASDTSLGINGSLNTVESSGKIVIGYDRKFIAYVPLKDDQSDAKPTYNCTRLQIKGPKLLKFYERMATGAAAEIVARNIEPSDESQDCTAQISKARK